MPLRARDRAREVLVRKPGDGDGGDAAGLGDGDGTPASVSAAVEDLRELGALARARLADDHHHRVRIHRGYDLVLVLRYRQHQRRWR